MRRVNALAATDYSDKMRNQSDPRKKVSDQDRRMAEATAEIKRYQREESVFSIHEFSGRIENKGSVEAEKPTIQIFRKGELDFGDRFSSTVDPVDASYDRNSAPDFSADTFRIGGPVRESFLLNDGYFKDFLSDTDPSQLDEESEGIAVQDGSGNVFDFFDE